MKGYTNISGYRLLDEETNLWMRMYASWAVHLGFSPSFLRVLLKESVLNIASTSTSGGRERTGQPFISTLLSSTFATHLLTDDPPENIVVNVFALFLHHFFDDSR